MNTLWRAGEVNSIKTMLKAFVFQKDIQKHLPKFIYILKNICKAKPLKFEWFVFHYGHKRDTCAIADQLYLIL